MFESDAELGDVTGLVSRLATLPASVDEVTRVARLRALEEVICAASAAQVRDAAALERDRRTSRRAAGVAATKASEGVAAEVAVAKRMSPHAAARFLGVARAVTETMPHTLSLMTKGRLTADRAAVMVRETAGLEPEDRAQVDEALCGGPDPVAARLADRELAAAARSLAFELDAAAAAARCARAVGDRRVSLRPAADGMAWLSALLPAADAVAAHQALVSAAATARAAGDPRNQGNVMADTLVHRLTGHDPLTGPADVQVGLVLTDASLLAGADAPAELVGYGPIPAATARDLIADAGEQLRVWVRQLYTGPAGGLTATSSRARLAPPGLARLIRWRDRTCRTPWCSAPIRHIDHITPAAEGGPTTAGNLQGLCERCNHARQATGWTTTVVDPGTGEEQGNRPGRHTTELTTPTGLTAPSTAPPLPGHPYQAVADDEGDSSPPGPDADSRFHHGTPADPPTRRSPIEDYFRGLLDAA